MTVFQNDQIDNLARDLQAENHLDDPRNPERSPADPNLESADDIAFPYDDETEADPETPEAQTPTFAAGKSGIFKIDEDGSETRLCNTDIRIVRSRLINDGLEERRVLEMEAEVGGQKVSFEVDARNFGKVSQWTLEKLGSSVVVFKSDKDAARAIQVLSGRPPVETVCRFVGPYAMDGKWVFLFPGRSIDANGWRADVKAEPSEPLAGIELLLPETTAERNAGIVHTLNLMNDFPAEVIVPCLGAVFRAPLGDVRASLLMSGATGNFKSTIAGIMMSFYGRRFRFDTLPLSFAGTANFMRSIAFEANGIISVFDECTPTQRGSRVELQEKLEAIVRSTANNAERGRVGCDGAILKSHYPRTLPVITSEGIDAIPSLWARMLDVPVSLDNNSLPVIQKTEALGHQGAFCTAMGAYVQWILKQYATLDASREERLQTLSSMMPTYGHARTARLCAEFLYGLETLLAFAMDCQAIDDARKEALWNRSLEAMKALYRHQSIHTAASDPIEQLFTTLRQGLATQKFHLTTSKGRMPRNSGVYGWASGTPKGEWIGAIDEEGIYILLDSFRAILARCGGLGMEPPSERAVLQSLNEKGYLVKTRLHCDKGGYMIQKHLRGTQVSVLHLRPDCLDDDALELAA